MSQRTLFVTLSVLTAMPFVFIPAVDADDIDTSTRVHVRLKQSVSSFGSKRDDRIAAAVIAPVESRGRILIPLDAEVLGHVESVKRVGLGMSHETAAVHLSFDTPPHPNGEE